MRYLEHSVISIKPSKASDTELESFLYLESCRKIDGMRGELTHDFVPLPSPGLAHDFLYWRNNQTQTGFCAYKESS